VYIHIKGEKAVTPESLLQYIVSMRKENHFHEEIAECIYKRLWDLLEPEELLVTCLYTRRGGIDINPTRASNYPLMNSAPIVDAYNFCEKTARQ
jgi:7-cyano-7-deazaguanine reductase